MSLKLYAALLGNVINYENRLPTEMRRVVVGEKCLYQPARPDAGEKILTHYSTKLGEIRDILLVFPQNSLDGSHRKKICDGILEAMKALESSGMSRSKEWEGLEILYKILEAPEDIDRMIGANMVECGNFIDVSKLDPETAPITPNMFPHYASKSLIVEPVPEEA